MHSLALTSSSIPPQKLEYAALPPNTSIIGAITVLWVKRIISTWKCFYHLTREENGLYKNLGNCEEELPKKPVGRLSADRLPTANRQATDSFPKKKIVEKTRIKHDIETIIISIDITYLPIDGKTISSDMFIESFWNAKRIYYSRKTTRQSMKSDLEVI